MQNKTINTLKDKIVLIPGITILLSLVLFACAYFFKDIYARHMNLGKYLSLHCLMEYSGTIICFAVFLITFFTYNRTNRLRLMLFGSFFFSIGALEIFHSLSFKGMPFFLIDNQTSNRTVTIWIISRLLASAGFLTVSFISADKKSEVNKLVFLFGAIVFAIASLVIASYYPGIIPPMYIEGQGLTLLKKALEILVAVIFFIAMLMFFIEYRERREILTPLLCAALILNIASEMSFICYGEIFDIFNFTGHIYKAVSYIFIFKVMFVKNVLLPYEKLSDAQNELKDYVDNLDRIVEQRTRQLKHMNRKLIEDLEYARDIQKALLPAVLPDVKGLSFNTFYYPAERLSGDFYDIYRIDDKNIGMYICDVSGHGVPAAMLTVFLKQCIENRLETDALSGKVSMPSEMLHCLYDSFNNTNFKDDVYIVLVYAVLNTVSNELAYSSAGMNVAPLIIKRYGNVAELPIKGFPICKFKGVCDVHYKDNFIVLDRGDRMLFYTDGLVEAENLSGEHFSAGKLVSILSENSGKGGDGLSAIIYERLFGFIGSSKIRDDVTFFLMGIEE